MTCLSLALLSLLAAVQGGELEENLPERASVYLYYDAVENGVLVGGRIPVDPANPLHTRTGPVVRSRGGHSVTTLIDNGPTGKRIDLVAVGDGFTAAELGDYASDLDAVIAGFFAEEPFAAYFSFFNVHRVDVISNESGVDNDPSQGVQKDTALDMQFWCSGIERLLCVDNDKAFAAAASAPAVDQIWALANSTKYGGAGAPDVATLASANGLRVDLCLHEFGHSFRGLADEYWSSGTTYTGGEHSAKNLSILQAADMVADRKKWWRWINASPGVVDTFEGGGNFEFGVYRATSNSLMRSLGRPFGKVNREQLILEIYGYVNPIDGGSRVGVVYGPDDVLFITPLHPSGHLLDVQWKLNGEDIDGAIGETFDLASLCLAPGQHELAVTVVDNTDWVVREGARAARMTKTRKWTVDVPLVPLSTDTDSLSVSAGGGVSFCLSPGSEFAGQPYLLLASASGTVPGFRFGGEAIPLNPDLFLRRTLLDPGAAFLTGSSAVLDEEGLGHASLSLPPGSSPALIGATLHFAHVVLEPAAGPAAGELLLARPAAVALVSNVVAVDLVP